MDYKNNINSNSNPTLLYEFFKTYTKDRYIYIIIIIVISIIINFIQTAGISYVIANIINYIKNDNIKKTLNYFYYFIGLSVIYIILLYFYKNIQSYTLGEFIQDMRMDFFEYILSMNNIEITKKNLSDVGNLVNGLSYNAHYAFYNFFDNILSNVIFVLVIFIYFILNNLPIGLIFLFGNILSIIFYKFNLPKLYEKRRKYRNHNDESEKYADDVYLNIQRIVTSGTVGDEIKYLRERASQCNILVDDFNTHLINSNIIITTIIYTIVCLIIGYSIKLKSANKIDNNLLITFITLVLIYRERSNKVFEDINEFIDFSVKAELLSNRVNNSIKIPEKMLIYKKNTYMPVNLQFRKIELNNLTFCYDKNKNIFKEYNNILYTDNNKIIGITGKSGNGKTSLLKLIIKLYNDYDGDILIDDINIREIDPLYIRNNIVYVHQNSNLLDRLLIDNIMYGCINNNLCEKNLDIIMSYDSIREVFKNLNLYDNNGKLGENLSGGQRQVINIINGLIKPCKILIIDEPTNALDPKLKKDVINLIKQFSKYKQAIIIVTHDKDVYGIMDERIEI